jgi:peroxiredoxin/mono/diheme cytochrome c family protein
MRSTTCLALVLLGTSGFAAGGEAGKPPRKVPAFALSDAAGKTWSLKDLHDKKAIVVVFLGTECPVNNAYLPRLAQLCRDYSPRGVQFLGVNSNCNDTPDRVALHAREHDLPFPVLKDAGNVVADKFGARRTPEAFVLEPDGTVRYRGRIDDQYGVGFRRPAPNRQDLAVALDDALAGEKVSCRETEAPGCLIARARKPSAAGRYTFTKHIAPILQRNCQECHRPGQIGPMPLLTYRDALAWSEMIREVVDQGRMPPWSADPRYGHFSNDRRLSDADRRALLGWVDADCPEGDPHEAPPPREFAEGWRIGKPDVVLTMTEEARIPARAAGGVPYQYFTVPTNFPEDRWVHAAEARPGNRSVVHHIVVFVREPGKRGERGHPDGFGRGLLTAFAPGELAAVLPPGSAKKIPKGAVLLLQMHYTPNGVEQTDRSSVGLIFAKGPPQREARTRCVLNEGFTIPPGVDNHEVRAARTFERDVELLGLFPHMHLRGKDFTYRVVYPDGRRETLLSVPRYDFNWQSNYWLVRPLALPAGTRIECTAHFDNSRGNRNNPDPLKRVHWGDQTWDEMMIGFVDYAYADGKPADAGRRP